MRELIKWWDATKDRLFSHKDIEHVILEDGSFMLKAQFSEGIIGEKGYSNCEVIYRSKEPFEEGLDGISQILQGTIPVTDLQFETITVWNEYFNQITKFYNHPEHEVFIGSLKKTKGFSMGELVIEQDGRMIYPEQGSIMSDIMEQVGINRVESFKNWFQSEYRKLKVDYYKANRKLLQLEQ